MLDPRVVIVTIEVNGQARTYQGLELSINGTKYANANQNKCEIKITNLERSVLDFILTETSPFNKNRTPKRVTVDAGRMSYGTSRIFTGEVASVTVGQPPDVIATLKCLTGNFSKGNIVSRTQPGQVQLSKLSQNVASDLGLNLVFQATDMLISNYNFTGGALKQVEKLGQLGNISVFVDDAQLIVTNFNTPLSGQLRVVDIETGMIGIPEVTEQGIKVKYLLDNKSVLGGALQIRSIMYPSFNGTYTIYKLNFEITNRDVSFYYIAEAKK